MDQIRSDKPEGAPACAQTADAGAPSGGARSERRFSARRKLAAVTRLLRGEPLETLARELNVTVARLSEWRDRALVAAEHVAKRLRRYRRRVNDHARGLAEERAGAAETAPQYVVSAAEDEDAAALADGAGAGADGADHSVVVAEQPAEIARLSVSEAVMRLDLAQVAALPFRNSGSGAINLVYTRPRKS